MPERQWIIPDGRVIDYPRPPLWSAQQRGQIYVVEQHSQPVRSGPGIVFSTLLPDMHYFKGSEGGRTLPLLCPDGSANLSPRLLSALPGSATAQDLLAYVAALVAHPGFTATFVDELVTPGVRVPITSDPGLFSEAAELGSKVLWTHTYGDVAVAVDRPHGDIRFPTGDPRQPLCRTSITAMPTGMTYDATRQVLVLGTGTFGPVLPAVWSYAVGGRGVLASWVNYRKAVPGGRRSSPLDAIHATSWHPDWTTELIDLLTLLTRLVALEDEQADLLARILDGPLLSRSQLSANGVRWPESTADRRPRYSVDLQVELETEEDASG